MHEQHPLDPPPSNVVGVQNSYTLEQWTVDADHIKANMLSYLYERLAAQQRIPVGVVEGGWIINGENVAVRMRVPTAPLLMDFAEHMEES